MNTALSWIKEYVPNLDCTNQEYVDAMTLSGTKVETFECLDKNLKDIYVGEILSIEGHPDADKLVICQVNIGKETLQIVTGANNINVGDKVPVVVDGGKVACAHGNKDIPKDGITIKNGKLRGVESFGMMCGIEELGSSKDFYPLAPEDGIYIFPADTQVGLDAIEVLGLRDVVFEYEITSNRVDCYSVLGIAREAAATFEKPFNAPEVNVIENDKKVEDFIDVEVLDKELCPRFCARVCTDIKIEPSPEWLQRRLAASGIRPINNLVDITNYVMEEYGQPMHAYDLDTIEGGKIIVRRANDGDKFTTLDGNERELDSQMLMICDANKEIGIAGIMGGENSMITDGVKTVLFEAATFNGANIRKSAKRLGLRTEASGKFEKGLDPNNALDAINRACQLISELGCGQVTKGVVDAKAPIKPLNEIEFSMDRINGLLGTALDEATMLEIFNRIECEVVEKDCKKIVIVPSFRQDLEGIADLAEEVARFYGYDKIPTTLPSGEATVGKLPLKLRIEQIARNIVQSNGFSQGMCYSFESPKVFDKLMLGAEDKLRDAIKISNPLGEDFSIMRTISLNGIMTSLATNYNRRNKDVRLYELGNVYLPKKMPLEELPDERMILTLGMYGNGDFFTMKGVIEDLFAAVGMNKKVKYINEADKKYLHPGRQANIHYNDAVVGYLGEVHPMVCENYDLKTRAIVAVIDMPLVVDMSTFDRKHTGIARFPAVTRDISMVVPKKISVGEIEEMIEKRGGKNLEEYRLFDIYEGEQIDAGFKSVAYSIIFRSNEKTLEDSDVNGFMKKILNGLEGMGIELRQ